WKGWAILPRQKQKKLIMLPSETMIWQPEFTDKTLSRKPGAVHMDSWVTTWEDSAEQVRDISGSLLPAELDLQYFDIGNADDKELF
ncbi:hypothetical protein MMR28_27975, partial [Escherichia coli]|nr:hypothetical protein [Escherichia coli]